MDFDCFPRIRLAALPTPLHALPRLSDYLGGPEIWVKRDDLTGLAGGGNKVRKLEFIVADALASGANTLVTIGGVQSNHTRQTAAAAVIAGLKCELVHRRWVPTQGLQYETVGNILFSRLLGAHIQLEGELEQVGSGDEVVLDTLARLEAAGAVPYVIPSGASDHRLGGLGYAACAKEIIDQAAGYGIEFDAIIHATSSGSTQAGLVAGLAALNVSVPVFGIEVDNDANGIREVVMRVGQYTMDLLGLSVPFRSLPVHIIEGYAGPAYGVPTTETWNAIKIAASTEALLLDPVYEGKAVAGLIGLIKKKQFDRTKRILYLHLGGTPALHAYECPLL